MCLGRDREVSQKTKVVVYKASREVAERLNQMLQTSLFFPRVFKVLFKGCSKVFPGLSGDFLFWALLKGLFRKNIFF